jgi:hypothetical protein
VGRVRVVRSHAHRVPSSPRGIEDCLVIGTKNERIRRSVGEVEPLGGILISVVPIPMDSSVRLLIHVLDQAEYEEEE